MKKKLIFILFLALFMFFPTITSHAATKINLTEVSNGVINTKFHFSEGFISGLDVVFKVGETVKVKNFEFNSEYKNFTKKYSYDSVNHTLRIIVTSGGIGSSHNLLNSKKELSLGKIILETDSKKSVEYTLDKVSLKYNDNNWNSITVPSKELTLGDEKVFNYLVKEEDLPPKEEEKDDENSDENSGDNSGGNIDDESNENTDDNSDNDIVYDNNSNTENNNSNSQTSTNKNPGSSNNKTESSISTPEIEDDSKEETDPSIDQDSDIITEPDDYNSDKDIDNKDNNEKGNNKTILIISVIAILLVVGILIIIYLSLKTKKRDIEI